MGSVAEPARDWVGRAHTNLLAWWIPQGAMLAGLVLAVPVRTIVWVIALAWMGTACIVNARRCGRTHCRFTGPYYLAMIVPVVALAMASAGLVAWASLAAVILFGSKIIWWVTERAWGRYS
jgi:hypothetical protein